MSELFKIVITSSLTILGGIIIFITGQIILRFFIEPLYDQKKTIGEIQDALIYHAREYGSVGICKKEKADEASHIFRSLATKLSSKTSMIPSYKFFVLLKITASLENIREASKNLIGLSNSLFPSYGQGSSTHLSVSNEKRRLQIQESLDIYKFE